jgi:FixJ family two-component response regulator
MTPTQGLVYVVDDDASFRRSVARLLTAEGYEVATFASAAEFLAQHSSVSRGCVLADLHMPGCSGLELQVQLAASSNPLPLVFLSGNGTAPSTVKALRQGAVDFLTKCAPDGDLLEAVGNAVLLDGCRYACRRALAEIQSIHNIR